LQTILEKEGLLELLVSLNAATREFVLFQWWQGVSGNERAFRRDPPRQVQPSFLVASMKMELQARNKVADARKLGKNAHEIPQNFDYMGV